MTSVHEYDDEGDWEPLIPTTTTTPSSSAAATTTAKTNASSDAFTAPFPPRASSAAATTTHTTTASSSRSSSSSRIPQLQQRLHDRVQVQQTLIDHPMQLLVRHLVLYLCHELWLLHWKIRLALTLIVLGTVTKLFIMSTLVWWYPRWILTILVLVVPLLYVQAHHDVFPAIRTNHTTPMDVVDHVLAFMDSQTLRRVCIALLLVPTWLEFRTLLFLTHIHGQANWITYNVGTAALIGTVLWYSHQSGTVSRDYCTHRGLLLLYGSALLVSILRLDLWHMPLLLAPFCTATGVLLFATQESSLSEHMARAGRQSLRLALRDVLGSVSTNIAQDELLQLAMLRWIADYWANNNNNNDSATTTTTTTTTTTGTATTTTTSGSTALALRRSNSRRLWTQDVATMDWTELLPMLAMTADQMATEVDQLQGPHPTNTPCDSNEPIPNTGTTGTTPAGPSFSTFSSSSRPSATSSAAAPDSSFDSLQSMLTHMDLDERAGPAVLAYKRSVQAFPPSRSVSILIAVARRCPALLAVLYVFLTHNIWSITTTLILLAFVPFELVRVKEWSEAVYATVPEEKRVSEKVFMESADPMVILLADDRMSLENPPSLLMVWRNISSSIPALETSLTAARCVQTTAVAADFAGNIISLANFGLEVSQRGWMHGVVVLLKELAVLHMSSQNPHNQSTANAANARVTNAAMSAVRNSRTISRNVSVLMEDEKTAHHVSPLLGAVAAIIGYGWLWGRPQCQEEIGRPTSSVVIEEIERTDLTEGSSAGVAESERSTEISVLAREVARADVQVETTPLLHLPETSALFDSFLRKSPDPDLLSIPSTRECEAERGYVTVTGDCSDILDLLAQCFELGFISESEKKLIFEKLAKLDLENELDAKWYAATRKTLDGLLHHSEAAKLVECSVDRTVQDSHQNDPHVTSVSAWGDDDGDAAWVNLNSATSSVDAGEEETFSEDLVLGGGAQLGAGDDAELEFFPGGAILPPTPEPSEHNTFEERGRTMDAEASEEALYSSSTSLRPELRKQHDSDPQQEGTNGGGVDNMWLQVGGGLAVIGAVAGGVAFALFQSSANNNRNNELRRHQEDASPQ